MLAGLNGPTLENHINTMTTPAMTSRSEIAMTHPQMNVLRPFLRFFSSQVSLRLYQHAPELCISLLTSASRAAASTMLSMWNLYLIWSPFPHLDVLP